MLKYSILIFLFLTSNLFSEITQKIVVVGNDRISEETIKVYGEISLNKDYTDIDINNILKNLYETDFFEDVKISLKNGIMKINVKEYAIINSIKIEGEKANKTKELILKELQLKEKGSFIESKLIEDEDILKKIYASMGFNFLKVNSKIKRFDENRINLVYFLEKGKKTDIKEINFIGDKKIKEKRLRDIIVSEESKFWKFLSKNTFLSQRNIELDKRLIVNYYKSLGYYDVQVLSSNAEISKSNFTTLTYTINAGTRYRVNKISTNVSDVLDKKLFIPLEKNFNEIIGKYYSPFRTKKLLEELDLLIAKNDLQFIEHSINEILENDSIEIKVNIFEGEKQLVEKINILGNTVTDEAVIRSELELDEGDPFNNLKLSQSIAKLKGRKLFRRVEKTVKEGTVKNQKIIQIEVEEQPTGEISAGAGIGTNGGSLAFSVKENNWLGRGIRVDTDVNVSKTVFTGGIDITDPNYNFSGNAVSFFLRNTTNYSLICKNKNNIVTLGIGTPFEQYRDVFISPAISYSYDDLKLQDTASKSMKNQAGTFSDLTFEYDVTLDKRDRVYQPTDGYRTGFSQEVPIYADAPFLRNSFNFSQFKTFNPSAVGKVKFFATAINGLDDKDVRISKRSKLGYTKLRGFEAGKVGPKDGLDYVGGNYAIASNFELSLPNLLPEATKTDVGLFLDLGNVWNVDYDDTVDDSNKIRSTAGINTSWTSPVGPMSFIFSKNITKASTDVVETFNFRLGTTF